MKALIFIVLTISLGSCKESYCPAFPVHLIDYYPYSKGDLVQFKNMNSDTQSIKILTNWVSDGYSFERNCKCS